MTKVKKCFMKRCVHSKRDVFKCKLGEVEIGVDGCLQYEPDYEFMKLEFHEDISKNLSISYGRKLVPVVVGPLHGEGGDTKGQPDPHHSHPGSEEADGALTLPPHSEKSPEASSTPTLTQTSINLLEKRRKQK